MWPKSTRSDQKGHQIWQNGAKRVPKRSQNRGAQRVPKGSQREPKGSQVEPKGCQKGAKGDQNQHKININQHKNQCSKKVAKRSPGGGGPGWLLGAIFGPFSIKKVIKKSMQKSMPKKHEISWNFINKTFRILGRNLKKKMKKNKFSGKAECA